MPNYKRARFGNTYFFTVATHERRPILCLEPCREILRDVMNQTREKYPFTIEAMVLLPDHLHCIWKLPEHDTDYSMRWGFIKKEFTKRARGVLEGMAGIAVGAAHPTVPVNVVGIAHPTVPANAVGIAHPTNGGSTNEKVGWAAPTGNVRTQSPGAVGRAHPTADGPDDPNVGWAAPTEGPRRPTGSSNVGWALPTAMVRTPIAHTTPSRIKHREGTVWQRRFWEHQIRDQEDFNAHLEYIHYNRVKHGFVKAPIDWEHSSFGRFVREGIYDRDWGAGGSVNFDDSVGNE